MTAYPLDENEFRRIDRLRRKLRRTDPLLPVVDALLADDPLPPDYSITILSALHRHRGRSPARGLAAWAAGVAPLSPGDALAANSHIIAMLSQRSALASGACATSCFCFPMFMLALPLLPFLVWLDGRSSELREMAAVALGRLGFGISIPALCTAIVQSKPQSSTGDKAVQYAVAYALSMIMGRDPRNASGTLNDTTEYALRSLLNESPFAGHGHVLNVLRIAGSPRSIRTLQRFLKKTSDPGLTYMAGDAIKAINGRIELERQRSSLLRPAEMPADPGTLLRPVTYQETDQSLLLRPHEGSD